MNIETAFGVHLVRNGDPEADFRSDWSQLPSPKPYFLFTHGMGRDAASYFKLFFKLLAISAAVFALGYLIARTVTIDASAGVLPFLGYAAVICSLFALLLFVAMYVGEKGMRTFVDRLFRIAGRKQN